jgi:ATP-dependent protease ClpP protease subunit
MATIRATPSADAERSTAKLVVDGELVLYGTVGSSMWDEDGSFSAKEVIEALAGLKGDLTVRINSGGGSAWDGIAIHNALAAHKGAVTIKVDGVAASAASVILMAADSIVCPGNASIMIHNSATFAYGDKAEIEKTRAMLEKLDRQMADLYADRTGLKASAVTEMMDAETWMTGSEAVAKGFADRTSADVDVAPAAFAYSLYSRAPAALASVSIPVPVLASPPAAPAFAAVPPGVAIARPASETTNEAPLMSKPTPAAETAPVSTPTASVTPDAAATIANDAVRAERKRASDIKAAVKAARLDDSVATELIDAGVEIDAARAKIIDKLAAGDQVETRNAVRVDVTADGRDRRVEGVQRALMARAGDKSGERNEFTGLTLREVARVCLEGQGVRVSGVDPMKLVAMAFNPRMAGGGMHSTSDFAHILENIASKSMLKGYAEAEETFDAWTAKGSLSDFKPTKRVDLGLFPSLAQVQEGAEYTYATVGDRGETIVLATYGRMFSITRQAVINDDMDQFTKIPQRMGRAAKRTIGDMVYAILTSNPTMADGVALFHASHANLLTPGAPAVATIDAARAAMAKQRDKDSIAVALNLRPKYFLGPVELEGTIKSLMASEFDPSKTQRVPNHVRGSLEVITDARLSSNSATAWYTAADPNQTDTIEVAYLNGNEAPYIESKDGWSVDGVEMKVRIDTGVKALDFRGLQKNAGA